MAGCRGASRLAIPGPTGCQPDRLRGCGHQPDRRPPAVCAGPTWPAEPPCQPRRLLVRPHHGCRRPPHRSGRRRLGALAVLRRLADRRRRSCPGHAVRHGSTAPNTDRRADHRAGGSDPDRAANAGGPHPPSPHQARGRTRSGGPAWPAATGCGRPIRRADSNGYRKA